MGTVNSQKILSDIIKTYEIIFHEWIPFSNIHTSANAQSYSADGLAFPALFVNTSTSAKNWSVNFKYQDSHSPGELWLTITLPNTNYYDEGGGTPVFKTGLANYSISGSIPAKGAVIVIPLSDSF